jgi:hypothetical protein
MKWFLCYKFAFDCINMLQLSLTSRSDAGERAWPQRQSGERRIVSEKLLVLYIAFQVVIKYFKVQITYTTT